MTNTDLQVLLATHKTASDLYISVRENNINMDENEAMEEALELSVKFMNKFENTIRNA
ncbi:MAG: hypothetical protein Unbinned4388contig1000_17 [Prokaryotic dsDNA virus sp.]|nr:MAG: hypothetical protein Unbinned4388contig1000_17 [Prokaryotic dsDNA virus sp.]|tara:strand:+ start:319 stop:492 length:174 start_codon:yes stop_codon:yes gene_type:complete